jgi:cellulose synthase/poly-beta-1,6-N-acetylglucosamine synthase-like glycosyltransferase
MFMDIENEGRKPFVSVIMTVLNVERTIEECLGSLTTLDYPKDNYEIIIVDGKSRDNTVRIIAEYAKNHSKPEIKIFEKPGSIGAGRNEALKHVKGEFIAITDGDMVVEHSWLSELIKAFDEGIAGVGGPNNNADDYPLTKCISSLDIQGPSNDVVPFFGENRYSESFTSDSDVYTTVCRNTCYRKTVLKEVRGFDEKLIGAEDPELNIKLLKKGYSLRYTPKAVVYHHHRSTLTGFFKQQRLFAVGQAFVNKKHPELFKPIQLLPTIAFAFLVLLLIASFLDPFFAYLVLVILVAYILFFFLYGLKCAKIRNDMRIAFLMPVVVLTWHLAWMIYYPEGLMKRGEYGSQRA